MARTFHLSSLRLRTDEIRIRHAVDYVLYQRIINRPAALLQVEGAEQFFPPAWHRLS